MLATTPGESAGIPGHDPQDVMVRLYSSEGFLETHEEVRYLQWGASSFRVMQTPAEEEGYGCLVGAERGTERTDVRGAGVRGPPTQLSCLVVGLVGSLVLNS